MATLKRVAPTGSRVLITGPAGVGKEIAARMIHQWSPRASAPFIVVSAATMSPERVEEELGNVEVLVANAGITRDGLLVRMSDDDFEAVIATNLTATWRMAKRVVPKMMRARWGRIVVVSSVQAYLGAAGQANYAASKAGLIALTKTVAVEVARRGVTANAVVPGLIDTEMTAGLEGPITEGATISLGPS